MKAWGGVLAILVACVFLSCAAPQRNAQAIKVLDDHMVAIAYPTEIRGAYFNNEGGRVRFCAEPTPDVAMETVQSFSADLTAKITSKGELDAKTAAELSAKVVQLAGRTELLLLAREMLYRACELELNNPTTPQDALTLYLNVAQLIKDLGEAEKNSALADLERVRAARKAAGDIIDHPGGGKTP